MLDTYFWRRVSNKWLQIRNPSPLEFQILWRCFFKEYGDALPFIVWNHNCLHSFRYIVNFYEDVLIAIRTHKRIHEVDSTYIKTFNLKDGCHWYLMHSWSISLPLALVTPLKKVMWVFIDGFKKEPTLKNFGSHLSTTIVTPIRRCTTNFHKHNHFNFGNATSNHVSTHIQ